MNDDKIEEMAARMVELETRLAFQDHTLEDLNEALIGQQRQLDRMENDLKLIRERLGQLLNSSEGPDGR